MLNVKEFVGLLTIGVPYHDALLAVWSEFTPPLLLGCVGVGRTSEGAEESWIDLAVEENLIGDLFPESGGGTASGDVGSGGHGVGPERFWKFGFLQHGVGQCGQGLVCSLC